jgi:hypothetical protein
MDARLYILTKIDDACRQMRLDDFTRPTWTEGQLFRSSRLRLERGDASGWRDSLGRLDLDRKLTIAVRSLLIEQYVVIEIPESQDVKLNLPSDIEQLSVDDEEHFVHSLNVWDREAVAVFADPFALIAPDLDLYKTKDPQTFIPPSRERHGEIMYVEMKPGLTGPARIGLVTFSKTRKTIYYNGKKLQSLKGAYKANYYDVETGMWYWVSKCRKDGNDTLYPGIVDVDDAVREEYWTQVRRQPEHKHLAKFRSPGKYSKRRPS